jgi:Icc-related predicted phosphoesterase
MAKRQNSGLTSPIFDEPTFNERVATPDPSGLAIVPDDDGKYKDPGVKALLNNQVVGFDKMSGNPGSVYTLASALGPQGADAVKGITDNGQIVFHMAGDTGASNDRKYDGELHVCDQMVSDCRTNQNGKEPAFFFNLGDLVYDFGESEYYYEEFYEPYREYPGPIFAIPGNHDSFVLPNTPAVQAPLSIFQRNFCATSLTPTSEAKSLHRSPMMQPGVYFTLDAPFVRIIGLFSNALEDPGVISSEKEGGKWAAVPDYQLAFLTAQLQNIVSSKYSGAVILAVHHPPFSFAQKGNAASGNHGGSPVMRDEIDGICKSVGFYPHVFISGHAHNYQRYTRTVQLVKGSAYEVPFIVCGNGGHNVQKLYTPSKGQKYVDPDKKSDASYMAAKGVFGATKLVLENYDHTNFGYLLITANPKQLQICYRPVPLKAGGASLPPDIVTVKLLDHTIG